MDSLKLIAITLTIFALLGGVGSGAVVAQETTDNNTTTNNTTTATPTETPSNNSSNNTSDDGIPSQIEQNKSTTTIGYWEGVWYNDSFEFDDDDSAYLDQSDREKLTKRAIARIEVLRNSTFVERPPVNVITREAYQRSSGGYTPNNGSAAIWNNIVWKSVFMVDEDTNVENELEKLYGGQVRAFYSPGQEELYIIVGESQTDLVRFQSTSLVHELVHAYQDQHYDLNSHSFSRETQDGDLAKNSIVEGEAVYIENKYREYCETGRWDCYTSTAESTTGTDSVHIGLQLTAYFPYSDGHAYVKHQYDTGGWDAVNESYRNIPTHTTQIIHYDHQTDATRVHIPDDSGPYWRTYNHGVNGQERVGEATLAVMFWYQQHEYGIDTGISDSTFSSSDDVSRYNYEYDVTSGLEGDAILPYYHDTENRTGYIFATDWNSSSEATEFREGYVNILRGHGGEERSTDLSGTVYVLPEDSGFSGVYYITQEGDRLEVTHGDSLDTIRGIQGIEGSSSEVVENDKSAIQEYFEEIPLPTLIVLGLAFLFFGGYFVKYLVFDVRKKRD